jgi:gas vesicle protein
MAGILDKIKGMFGGAKSSGDGGMSMDTIKEKAGEVKDKVDDLVEKAGEKVPDKVKDTYEKVSDKVESIIPGKDDAPAAETEGGSAPA